MTPESAIALALAVIELIERAATLVPELAKIVQDAKTTLLAAQNEGRDITPAEFAAVREQIDAVLADLNKD
jgi:hypothetical protein